MNSLGRIIGVGVVGLFAATTFAGIVTAPPAAATSVAYGMRQYTDRAYSFSFWYPRPLRVRATRMRDGARFPGGVAVEVVQVGPAGGVALYVVDSRKRTITDEPNGHAAPFPQTEYFYDGAAKKWMVAYPEGTEAGQAPGPKPADVSAKTIGGLPMLPSAARFDTTIIPLTAARFIVVQDGGGSMFTRELARTVAKAGARVRPAARSAALKTEAAAYAKQVSAGK